MEHIEGNKIIELTCEKCGTPYEKREQYKIWNEQYPNVFFKWSLTFCDTCRREKEIECLQSLPKVLNALSKTHNHE